MFTAELCHTECKPDPIFYGAWEIKQICLGGTNPEKRLFSGHAVFSSHWYYPSFRIYWSISIYGLFTPSALPLPSSIVPACSSGITGSPDRCPMPPDSRPRDMHADSRDPE